MKQLKGKLHIGHPMGSDVDYVNIELTDSASGSRVVEIKIPLADFSRALFSRYMDCDFEWNDCGVIGLKHEHKTEIVTVPDGDFKRRDEIAAKAIKPFEVDGWSGRLSDATNHHRSLGGNKYHVNFHRHVHADGTPFLGKDSHA